MKHTAILASVAWAALASAAIAAPPACGGSYQVIRNSTVKPGKMDLFLKAVRDHQAWYDAHGLKDRILVGRVLSGDAGPDGFSSTRAMTFHTDLTSMAPPAHAADDAAWNAYVAEYKASSDLADMAVVCVEPLPRLSK